MSRIDPLFAACFADLVVVAFAFYYPIRSVVTLSKGAVEARLAPFDDCRKPDVPPVPVVKTKRVGTSTSFVFTSASPKAHYPPVGWCWL